MTSHLFDESSLKKATQSRDIVVALSSGPGPAGVAVIRMTGTGSHELIAQFISVKKWRYKYLHLTDFSYGQFGTIDRVLVAFFKSPNSYTGEDVVEIHCHGGPFVIESILKACLKEGAKNAGPGEFTRRAFLNGKIDLTTAEGVKEMIDAHAQHQWMAAKFLASGGLATLIAQLRGQVIKAMAYLEAQIDFPDEGDTRHLHLGQVNSLMEQTKATVERLARSYDCGRVCREGFRVAIVGRPNMGKSTLLNYLLGENRSIVTNIAGTTRDYIEERCLIHGQLVRLVDTAGLTSTNDVVESIGIESTKRIIEDVDLVIILQAKNELPEDIDLSEFKNLEESNVLRIQSKCDLIGTKWDRADLEISCQTGLGMDFLKDTISQRASTYLRRLPESGFITSLRHKEALDQASLGIQRFFKCIEEDTYEELMAFELQSVARSLGEIIGHVDNEDLLDRIFADFCIGK